MSVKGVSLCLESLLLVLLYEMVSGLFDVLALLLNALILLRLSEPDTEDEDLK